jgi:hypothetical protein
MTLRPSWRRILSGAFALLVVPGLVSPSVGSASTIAHVPKNYWGAHVLAKGAYDDLFAIGENLYGVRGNLHGFQNANNQVVRLDPASGALLSTSRVLHELAQPAIDGNDIWGIGVSWVSKNGERVGPNLLLELEAPTLHLTRSIRVPTNLSYPIVVGSVGSSVWLIAAEPAGRSAVCALVRVTFAARQSFRVAHRFPGGCGAWALDTLGRDVYILSDTQSSSSKMYKIDARTGRILEAGTVATMGRFTSMIVTNSRIWLVSGDPGANGVAEVLTTTHGFRQLDASSSLGGSMPTFSDGPNVDYSGGRVWIGSDGGEAACFKPADPRALAQGLPRRGSWAAGDFVDVASRVWGVVNTMDHYSPTQSGAARVAIPKACLAR